MEKETKMDKVEEKENSTSKIAEECAKNGDDYFTYLKKEFEKIILTPIPKYQLETIQLDDKTHEYLQKEANKHCCTIGDVINHHLEDFVSTPVQIKDLSPEKILELQKEKHPVLIMNDNQPIGRFNFFN